MMPVLVEQHNRFSKNSQSSDFFTELSQAVRDSNYATFGGLDSAHIAATETPFPEKELVALLSPVLGYQGVEWH